MSVRKITILAVFLAFAIAISVAETLLLSPYLLPGMKIGFGNIIILVILYVYGFKEGIFVSILKVFIVSLCVGNIFQMGFFMSLCGSLFSLISMYLLIKFFKSCSIYFVSIIGAITHCIGQICVGAFYIESIYIFYYLPILLITSILSGICIAFLVIRILKTQFFVNEMKKRTIVDSSL